MVNDLCGLRCLLASRLSRLTDTTNSPEVQRDALTRYAEHAKMQIVGMAEDLDVSGAKSPFKRPELGPWLNDRVGAYDVILFTKVDRISRSLIDFVDLLKWCKENGKRLVCVELSLDFSSEIGQLIGMILAWFAEMERARIKLRIQEMKEYLRKKGRYAGQSLPYWVDVTNKGTDSDDKQYFLVEKRVDVVMGIIKRALNRDPWWAIARDLNAAGIEPPRVAKEPNGKVAERFRKKEPDDKIKYGWMPISIKKMLQSRGLLGQLEIDIPGQDDVKPHKRLKMVCEDDDGNPVQFFPGIVDESMFETLQQIINEVRRETVRQDGDPMGGIIRCPCGAKRYVNNINRGGKTWTYYICARKRWKGEKCKHPNVMAANLLETVESEILATLGDCLIGERVETPADDVEKERKSLQDSRRKFEKLLTVVKNEEMEDDYIQKLGTIAERLSELERMPARKPGDNWRITDQRLVNIWARGDWENNAPLLRNLGIHISAAGSTVHVVYPADIYDRVAPVSGGIPATPVVQPFPHPDVVTHTAMIAEHDPQGETP